MATVVLTEESFDEVLDSSDIVLVDFWAAWCGPCRSFGPVFEEASERHPGVTFAKCDTEAQRELASTFQIRAIPTLAAFRGRIMVFIQSGALPGSAIDELVEKIGQLDMDELRAEIEKERQGCGDEGEDEGQATGG